jgi:hypothetical protein
MVFSFMKSIAKELESELKNTGLYDALQNIIKNRSGYKCFKLRKIRWASRLVYTSPYFDIVENEIKNVEEYILKDVKGVKWKRISDHVYREPHDKQVYIIDYNGSRLLISSENKVSVESRVIYAHAGLAYGLPWLAFRSNEKRNINLYLGDSSRITHILYTV